MMARFALAAGVLAVCGLSAGTEIAQSPPSRYTLRWETRGDQVVVRLSGLSESEREALNTWGEERWKTLLSVHSGNPGPDAQTIPMAGRYEVHPSGALFTPAFPVERGVHYYAAFRPQALPVPDDSPPIIAGYFRPRLAARRTQVLHIYPSTDVVPANLLKFYVYFSGPMSRGGIYEHVALLDDKGKEVDIPFLEIDEELWNPQMTRITLIIDPGRIKRGVKPLEDIGPALEAGKQYTLVIHREWPDAAGHPLAKEFRKQFRASRPDRTPIDPNRWRIHSPRAGTRNPLAVDFAEPMDHALGSRVLWVLDKTGKRIEAHQAGLSRGETRWSFTPMFPWKAGRYHLTARTILEDLAGNNIGKPFEVDVFKSVQRRLTSEAVRLPFRVR